jgi:alkylhydroperoxidase family enzyme
MRLRLRLRLQSAFAASLMATFPGVCLAGDVPASDVPSKVAATRQELKEQLEGSKRSHPRLPLPPPTEAEVAAARARADTTRARPGSGGLGGGLVNNGRMRGLYLPPDLVGVGGGSPREPDPRMTLENTFKTMLFWIVSRANNCAYCQGHQEVKLAGDGVGEGTIAALDGDWSEFAPAQRAAFAFTRKLTTEPDAISGADIDRLRPHYSDLQILEVVMAVSGFNATNRWTGPLAIPQEGHRVFLTPTPESYRSMRSRVAPLDPAAAGMACAKPASRGALESREQVEKALDAARKRSPRLPLADEARARAVLPEDWSGSEPLPQWARLLGNFPKGGKALAGSIGRARTGGKLSPVLKAKIAWVGARNDRAWYALGHARRRLNDLGVNDDRAFALDRPDHGSTPAEQAALALVRKITVDPALITDADVEAVRAHYSDPETAEVVYLATQAASFDRLTEAAGLPLER